MPHSQNVQLSTCFSRGMCKRLSGYLGSNELNVMMRPTRGASAKGAGGWSHWTPPPPMACYRLPSGFVQPSPYVQLYPVQGVNPNGGGGGWSHWMPPLPWPRQPPSYVQVRNYAPSQRLNKAQELPVPHDQSRSNPNEKRSQLEAVDWPVASPNEDEVQYTSEDDINSLIADLRDWKLTELGVRQQRQRQPGMELTVLSYNVLAQCLLDDNNYLYRRCQGESLRWDYRRSRLLKELSHLAADIVCLQEVEKQHYADFFVPELDKLGYSGVYKKRTGDKNDGCAIFYKRHKFHLRDMRVVEFCKPGVKLLDRDNVALLAVLEPRSTSSGRLCVANTHLLYNPGRGDIKLAQLKILLAEIDRLAFRRFSHNSRPLYHPVILCGDLNSEPHCYLYRLLCRGSLHYEGLTAGDISGQSEGVHRGRFPLVRELFPSSMGISDRCQYLDTVRTRNGLQQDPEASPSTEVSGKISHSLNFVSTYKHSVGSANQPEVTTNQNRIGCTVDYIFYSVQHKKSVLENHQVVHKDVKEHSLSLLATYSLLTDRDFQKIGHLPNAALPSDHLPLMAKFLLKES